MILSLSLLTACAGKPPAEVVRETAIIERNIPIVARPDPVKMNNVNFRVINQDNLEEFLYDLQKKNGRVVFIALTTQDYENTSINIQELRRYIAQQQEIIVYYESQLR